MASSPVRVLLTLSALAGVAGVAAWREHEWRARTRDLTANPSAATATPQPAGPATAAGGGSLLDANAALQRQAVELEGRIRELQAENRELREQLAQAREAAKPPPTPENLADELSRQRELSFQEKPSWSPAPLEDILDRIRAGIEARLPEEAAAARSRSALALGFHTEPFDYREALVSLEQMVAGGFWDAASNRFYYQAETNLSRADGRESFIGALAPALLAQNFPVVTQNALATDNDDAAVALQSLYYGDANQTRVRFSIADRMNLNFDQSGAPAAPPPTYNAPVYLAEIWKFTHDKGSLFVETLQAKGGAAAVNAAYGRPPRSTAEIIHPEELYLADPPFVPADVRFPEEATVVNGQRPLFSNVAGELGVYIILRSFLDIDQSASAAEGWEGDRFLVWEGSEDHGDHFFWKTQWRTPEDATEFFRVMRRVLMQRHSIPWLKEYDVAEDAVFKVDDPRRVLRLIKHPDGRTVTLLNATDPGFAAALEQANL